MKQDPKELSGFKSLDDYQEAYNLEKVDANPANWGRGIEEPEEKEEDEDGVNEWDNWEGERYD